MRSWENMRATLYLDENKKFYCRQINHTIACNQKEIFLECGNNLSNLKINEHHLIKKIIFNFLEKLNSRELYNMQLILKVEKLTAKTYFEKNVKNPDLNQTCSA